MFCIRIVPLGVEILGLPTPVNIINDLQEARRAGLGLGSLDSKTKNREPPLTQADAPKSTKKVSLKLAVALIMQMQTLSGCGGQDNG
jgi:hypothetical protein